jgi:bifunctional non-homologous end joining protein LigD
MLATVRAGRVRCWTRHGTRLGLCITGIADELLLRLPDDSLLDGELVALGSDAEGRVGQDFGRLGGAVFGRRPCTLSYVVFDVVRLAGRSLAERPWAERREALEATLAGAGVAVTVVHTFSAEVGVHEELLQLGFEGSVLKRRDARYQPGRRSPAWQKVKTRARCAGTDVAVTRDRDSGAVERVGVYAVDDPDRLTWAGAWVCDVVASSPRSAARRSGARRR